jgi:hypothetical protein
MPKITGKSRKKAEDQPLVPGDFRRAFNYLEPVAFVLRNSCAKFAQRSRLPPLPQAVLREDV